MLCVKAYYDGRNFRGSQIQPDQRTVEGEIIRCLSPLGIRDLKSAGRTDAGVSALGNVFCFRLRRDYPLKAMNALLPEDVVFWASSKVEESFNPRHARERIYRYFLYDSGYSMKRLMQAAELLSGRHSFHSFAKLESGKNPIREVEIKAEKLGNVIVLTFRGRSFLWQMVRRLVSAIALAASGEVEIAELKEALTEKKSFPPAPPEYLVLWDVKYDWEFSADYESLQLLRKKLEERFIKVECKRVMLEKMLEVVK